MNAGTDEFLDVMCPMEYNNITLNDRRLYRKNGTSVRHFQKNNAWHPAANYVDGAAADSSERAHAAFISDSAAGGRRVGVYPVPPVHTRKAQSACFGKHKKDCAAADAAVRGGEPCVGARCAYRAVQRL